MNRARQAERQRRAAGQMRRTKRDLTVLPWIGKQYAVRFDHLHALLNWQPVGITKERR